MLQLGIVLKAPYALYNHYGIVTGHNTIIHNSKEGGKVEEVSFHDFTNGREVEVSSIQADESIRQQAVERAKQMLGTKYNLFSENCEHFVSQVSGNAKASTQVQKYLVSAFGIMAFFKSNNQLIKAVGLSSALAVLFTDSETSPIENVLVAAGAVGGAIVLLNEDSDTEDNAQM